MNTIVSSFHKTKKTEWRTKGAECRKKVRIRLNNLFVYSLLIKTWCCSVFFGQMAGLCNPLDISEMSQKQREKNSLDNAKD